MIQVMLDTNIFIDVLIKRLPFAENSRQIISLCENKIIAGWVCATTVTDIFYYLHKHFHNTELSYNALSQILKICKVAAVTSNEIKQAYIRHARDFEDCLLATCAQSQHCDYVVTRNKKDFAELPVKAVEPEELLHILGL